MHEFSTDVFFLNDQTGKRIDIENFDVLRFEATLKGSPDEQFDTGQSGERHISCLFTHRLLIGWLHGGIVSLTRVEKLYHVSLSIIKTLWICSLMNVSNEKAE
jgi:hypothetical protein